MSASLQVLYPNVEGTHFDQEYYTRTHLKMVSEVWGDMIDRVVVTKGVAGGPDVPPPFHAIATVVFTSPEAMQKAMDAAKPLLDDIPNFTDTRPQMLLGVVIG